MNKQLHIYRILPSLITIIAFILGINAIIFSVNGETKQAIYFLIIAALLDLFDGRIARLLGSSSKFGEELDSLSDLTCFGVATAIIVLFYVDNPSKILYLGILFYSVCTLIRLARFNIKTSSPLYSKSSFDGVPAPGGFILAMLPIGLDISISLHINDIIYAIYMIVVGFLMISNIPTISTKNIKVSGNNFSLIISFITLFLIFIIIYPWYVIPIFGTLYWVSITISLYLLYKTKKNKKTNNKIS